MDEKAAKAAKPVKEPKCGAPPSRPWAGGVQGTQSPQRAEVRGPAPRDPGQEGCRGRSPRKEPKCGAPPLATLGRRGAGDAVPAKSRSRADRSASSTRLTRTGRRRSGPGGRRRGRRSRRRTAGTTPSWSATENLLFFLASKGLPGRWSSGTEGLPGQPPPTQPPKLIFSLFFSSEKKVCL